MTQDWRYSGGDGWGVVGSRIAALLPPAQVTVAQRLWSALDAGAGADAALAELMRDGIDSVAAFALAEVTSAGVRVLVRGTGSAVVIVADGRPVPVTADGGHGWRDELLRGAMAVQVGIGPGAGLGVERPDDLPFRLGVVRTSRLTGSSSPSSAGPLDIPAPAEAAAPEVPVSPSAEPAWPPPAVTAGPAWPPPAVSADPGPFWAASPPQDRAPDPGLTLLPPAEPDQPEPVPAPPRAAPESQPGAELPPDVDPAYLQLISGHTVLRTVEGAAVRSEVPSHDAGPPPVDPARQDPAAGHVEPAPTGTPEVARVEPAPAASSVARAEPQGPALVSPAGPPGLISSMPFDLGGPSPVLSSPPSQTPTSAPPMQSVSAPDPGKPWIRPSAAPPAGVVTVLPTVPTPVGHPDDEAGLTIARVARDMGAVDADGVPLASRRGWLSSLMCPIGHANPPVVAVCRVCGQSLASAVPQLMERPVIGRLTFDGPPGVIIVTRSLVIGRKPAVERVAGDDVPDLVPVPTNDGGVSRSHVRIGVDGWHVTVHDLQATNGTVVIEPDGTQRRLRPGEERLLVPGCRVVLGDTVSFVFGTRP